MTREVWKPIPSAPGWFASSNGRVRLLTRKVKMPNGGYKNLAVAPTFGFLDKRAQRHRQSVFGRSRPVSQLVCEAFHGPRPSPDAECMHLDEDSKNNRPANLAWGTKSENLRAPKYIEGRRTFMRALWAKRREAAAICRDI